MPQYPSLDELIRARRTGGPGEAIQSGLEGFMAGRKRRQEEEEARAMAAIQQARQRLSEQTEARNLRETSAGLIPANLSLTGAETTPEVQRTLTPEKPKSREEGLDLTPGEVTLDKEFAKDANDFASQGGIQGQRANFKKLENSIKRLETFAKSPDATKLATRASSVLPDKVRGLVTPTLKAIEQDARANVLGLLRQTLGPQFTQKEGEQIFNQTYDQSLPPSENLSRLKILAESLKNSSDTKRMAVEHFRRHGTLRGFQGALPSFADIAPPPREEQAAPLEATTGAPSGMTPEQRRARIAELRAKKAAGTLQ